MPPKANQKDNLIILVNVGYPYEKKNDDETSFLDNAKLVMQHLIQRSIFVRPKDEVGVIVMGASETKNRLSYDNILEMCPLQVPTWELIENILKLQETKETSNWVDGLNFALAYINEECVTPTVSRTLILLNDFNEDPDIIEQYNIISLANDVKAANITLLSIGNKSLNADSQIELNPSEELFANICKLVEGESMTFEETIPKLRMYKSKTKNPMPWRVNMNLFEIPIPIKMYLNTTDDFSIPKGDLYTDTDNVNVPVNRERSLVDKNKEKVSADDVISGYMYGRKIVPVSDEDKTALQYQSGPKALTIYGFTKNKHISMDCLSGTGSYIVVPEQAYAKQFYSLVKAMADKKKVAIARRVYQMNRSPKMGVLFPKIDVPGHLWCLIYVELVYAENRRIVRTKPIKSTMNKLSKEQVGAIDDLIDSMMLTEVEDDTTHEKKEAFQAGDVHDVTRQYVWDNYSYRALNPDSPLPPMSDFLNKIFEPPRAVQEKSKPVLKTIETLFPIKIVEKKKRFKKQMPNNGETNNENLDKKEETVTKEEIDIDKNMHDAPIDEEELCRVAEAIEVASQDMDIDLEELAKDM